MAKKDKNKNPETTIENYYDLKVEKIDELVAALKDDGGNSFADDVNYAMNQSMGVYDPQNVKRNGKEKEFDPYKTDFLGRIPCWLKALFVKFWFAAAVCYFVTWGIKDITALDSLVLTGAVLGIIVDVMVNPAMRFMETDKREYNNYMMFPFPFKAFWTFFTNIIYYVIVVFLAYSVFYFGINEFCNYISGTSEYTYLAVEPLFFGVATLIIDMIFIGIKDGVVALVRHLKNKKKERALNV